MKSVFTSLFFLLTFAIYSQAISDFPDFLVGVWQAEGQNLYEKWEIENENLITGESFKIEAGAKKNN